MPQVRYSKDGSKWEITDPRDKSSAPINWSPDPGLVKLVIGDDPDAKDDKRIRLASDNLPANFTELYPKLTHLHLWGIAGLMRLPKLPESLRCLDVRGCPDLALLTNLPEGLEELLIESASTRFDVLPTIKSKEGRLRHLRELSLAYCRGLDDGVFKRSISLFPDSKLQRLNLTGTSIKDLDTCLRDASTVRLGWPEELVDLRLNDMEQLVELPQSWPSKLRRLEIRNVKGLSSLPEFGKTLVTLDYIDLRGMHLNRKNGVASLPVLPDQTRTLFIHGAILNIPFEMYGDENENVALFVKSHQEQMRLDNEQMERAKKDGKPIDPASIYDHEIKIILLGNGRSGKTSLAKYLMTQEPVDPNEVTTHGIYLWELPLNFHAVDDDGTSEDHKAQIRIWDFAGQDLYHNTHRLFLQSRAIFIICETDHPKGYNVGNDNNPSDNLRPGEDVDRVREYWIDQVRSLGKRPGSDSIAPIIYVKTKTERPESERRADYRGDNPEGMIFFSSKSGTGYDELLSVLKEKVAEVLGTRQERWLGIGRKAVKDELRQIRTGKDANETVDPDEESKVPYITRSVFDETARRLCNVELDRERPETLLYRLHRSGFLFYGKELRKTDHAGIEGEENIVLLDQRWAVKGIYALFNRDKDSEKSIKTEGVSKLNQPTESFWDKLVEKKGHFKLSELSESVWKDYPLGTQKLFLDFMQQCGVCFEILDPSSAMARESVYTVPVAWPKKENVLSSAISLRNGIEEEGEPIVLASDLLGRDAVAQLLVRLGRQWGRDPFYWQWGGQFESFKNDTPTAQPTFVMFEWEPLTQHSFGGRFTLQQFGPDLSFSQAILDEAKEISGFSYVRRKIREALEFIERQLGSERSEGVSLSKKTGPRPNGADAHAPKDKCSIHIALSYGGDDRFPVAENAAWKDVSESSIERWPRALAHYLKDRGFHVEHFRDEQSRKHGEKQQDRQGYLDLLAKQDLMISVLSKKYLKSKYCMYEFSRAYMQLPTKNLPESEGTIVKELENERLYVFRFDDGNGQIVQGRANSNENQWTEREFIEHWKKALNDELAKKCDDGRLDQEDLVSAWQKLRYEPTFKWFQIVQNSTELELIAWAFRNWTIPTVPYSPAEEEICGWVDEIALRIRKEQIIYRYAVRLWVGMNFDDAAKHFLDALTLRDRYDDSLLGDYLQEVIEDNPILDAVRNHAYQIWRRQQK
jgi:GTPase SAR1 family protein